MVPGSKEYIGGHANGRTEVGKGAAAMGMGTARTHAEGRVGRELLTVNHQLLQCNCQLQACSSK